MAQEPQNTVQQISAITSSSGRTVTLIVDDKSKVRASDLVQIEKVEKG